MPLPEKRNRGRGCEPDDVPGAWDDAGGTSRDEKPARVEAMKESLKVLASTLAAEAIDTCKEGENQIRFLGVDSKTDQTVVVLVCVGLAAESVLRHLDSQSGVLRSVEA